MGNTWGEPSEPIIGPTAKSIARAFDEEIIIGECNNDPYALNSWLFPGEQEQESGLYINQLLPFLDRTGADLSKLTIAFLLYKWSSHSVSVLAVNYGDDTYYIRWEDKKREANSAGRYAQEITDAIRKSTESVETFHSLKDLAIKVMPGEYLNHIKRLNIEEEKRNRESAVMYNGFMASYERNIRQKVKAIEIALRTSMGSDYNAQEQKVEEFISGHVSRLCEYTKTRAQYAAYLGETFKIEFYDQDKLDHIAGTIIREINRIRMDSKGTMIQSDPIILETGRPVRAAIYSYKGKD